MHAAQAEEVALSAINRPPLSPSGKRKFIPLTPTSGDDELRVLRRARRAHITATTFEIPPCVNHHTAVNPSTTTMVFAGVHRCAL